MNSHWNYRVMVRKYENETVFIIHEVYYENSKPVLYTENPVPLFGESIEDLKGDLKLQQIAFSKPALWYGEKFPAEYNPKE